MYLVSAPTYFYLYIHTHIHTEWGNSSRLSCVCFTACGKVTLANLTLFNLELNDCHSHLAERTHLKTWHWYWGKLMAARLSVPLSLSTDLKEISVTFISLLNDRVTKLKIIHLFWKHGFHLQTPSSQSISLKCVWISHALKKKKTTTKH